MLVYSIEYGPSDIMIVLNPNLTTIPSWTQTKKSVVYPPSSLGNIPVYFIIFIYVAFCKCLRGKCTKKISYHEIFNVII